MSEIIGLACITVGLIFFLAGSIGLIRLPDFHSRLHALTKADNMGLGFICLGVGIFSANFFIALKLLLIWVLVLIASATSAALIANFTYSRSRK